MARYWVGGTNSWNTTAGTKWATASGGAGGAAVPTSADDVFFNGIATGGGSAGAINIGMAQAASCLSLDMTGFVAGSTWSNSASLAISGNLTLVAGITNSYTGNITFNATAGTKTVTCNTLALGSNVTFDGVGGTWQLQDNLQTAVGKTITLTNGTFQVNGKTLTCGFFVSSSSNVRTLDLTNSTLNLNAAGGNVWNVNVSTNMTSTLTGSRIVIGNTSGTDATMLIGNPAPLFNDIEMAGSGAANFIIATSNGTYRGHDLIITKTGVTTTIPPRTVLSGRIKMANGTNKILRNGGARQTTFTFKKQTWISKLAA